MHIRNREVLAFFLYMGRKTCEKKMRIESVKIGIKQLIEFVAFLIAVGLLWAFGADIWMILSVSVIMLLFFRCLRNINANVFFFFFLASFFIYLMSGDIAELFFDKKYYLQFGRDAVVHTHICLFISLVSIWLGYIFTPSKRNMAKFDTIGENRSTPVIVAKVRTASKLVYGVSFIVLIINTIDTIRFVAANGYIAYYTSFDHVLPAVIVQIGEFTPVALCVFLATFPTKKEASVVIRTYLLYAILSLFIGSRGGLIYNAIFLLCYCFYRNYTDRGHTVWVSKKQITVMILAIPFLLSFLFLYEYIRTGREVEYVSFGETIIDFFVNIGASSKVIKYGYEYAREIPKGRFYSFGETLNYFRYGTLFNLFDLGSIPARHSAKFAMESHSLDALISYLSMEDQFLDGHGTGSSFVAELFADFGYIGVSIGSFVYGWLFKKLSYLNQKNWLSSSIKLYMFMALLEAPRSSYDGFIAGVVNVNYLLIMVVIYMFATTFRSNSKKPYNRRN